MNRVVLIGQGPTAATAIRSLASQFEICAVFRSGPHTDEIAAFAIERSIPVYQELSLTNIKATLRRLRPACTVISSFDRIIDPELLDICPFINVHYGPLPHYRGRANVNWAILNQEPEAAITIHTVDAQLDSGNVLFQAFIPIKPDSTVTALYEQLNEIQRQELGGAVKRFLDGDGGAPQEGLATYCCTRTPADGEINWAASTRQVYALIRALAPPYPGAYTFFRLQKIKIVRAVPVSEAAVYVGRIPGRVCEVNRELGTVDVLTGDGVLRIYEIEEAGGECKRAASLIRSTKDTLGLTSRDLLQTIEELRETVRDLQRSLHLRETVPQILPNDLIYTGEKFESQ